MTTDDFAYISQDYKSIVSDVRKEGILNFFYKLDVLLQRDPKTEEEFQEKYDVINFLDEEEFEEFVEFDYVMKVVSPTLRVTRDNLYAITNDDCHVAIKQISRKIYLKICSMLVEKGILEPGFDGTDFTFFVNKDHRKYGDL